MRIAMIGSRGVPATFGGIEHHVEEVGARLADRGHDVVVYARTNYAADTGSSYRGMEVRRLATVDSKHLDAIVHSLRSTYDAIRGRFDVIAYHAIGPGVAAVIPHALSRSGVTLTVHGRDGERAKWGRGAHRVLTGAEWLSARVPDATIVVSQDLQRHYAQAYGRHTFHIPNGVDEPEPLPPEEIRTRWGLEPGSYVLFVGRLVPEKAPDQLVRVFRRVAGDLRLVIAGGSSFTDEFVDSLENEARSDPRVVMTGYVYGNTLRELYSNAAAFVLPSTLEGLPLTLLEAASYGIPLVASDIPPNVEIVREEAPGRRLFEAGSDDGLLGALELATSSAKERTAASSFAAEILKRYRWDAAVDETEAVYERVARGD
jgi:glycosyltransferase involved in cell wall biosynthesis